MLCDDFYFAVIGWCTLILEAQFGLPLAKQRGEVNL